MPKIAQLNLQNSSVDIIICKNNLNFHVFMLMMILLQFETVLSTESAAVRKGPLLSSIHVSCSVITFSRKEQRILMA